MSKIKNFIMEVQEFVWDFIDEDGFLFAGTDDGSATWKVTKTDIIKKVEKSFGWAGVEIAVKELEGVNE